MDERAEAARFVRCFTAAVVVGCLALLVLGLYVNPWGNFGPVGIQPIYNARLAKVEHLERLPQDELPSAYLLGSSNVMRYRPATIESELGFDAFNFGVFWGRSEDIRVIASYLLLDREADVDLFVVGLDVWTFEPAAAGDNPLFPGIRRRLLRTPQLARHLDGATGLRLGWSAVIDAFSAQQVSESVRLLLSGRPRQRQAPLDTSGVFDADGTRIHYVDVFSWPRRSDNIFSEVEGGTYGITELIRANVLEHGHLPFGRMSQYQLRELSETRLAEFERFLELTDEHGVRVWVVLNPIHPLFLETLRHDVRHSQLKDLVLEHLRAWQVRHDSLEIVLDAADIESFGGDPDAFHDEIHPATINCDRVIEKLGSLAR